MQGTFTLAQDVAITAPQGIARHHQITAVPRPQMLLHVAPLEQLRRDVPGLRPQLITSSARTFEQCFDSEARQGDPDVVFTDAE
ncbi:hypothetical protein D3C84_899450 [compost metagenome]